MFFSRKCYTENYSVQWFLTLHFVWRYLKKKNDKLHVIIKTRTIVSRYVLEITSDLSTSIPCPLYGYMALTWGTFFSTMSSLNTSLSTTSSTYKVVWDFNMWNLNPSDFGHTSIFNIYIIISDWFHQITFVLNMARNYSLVPNLITLISNKVKLKAHTV